MIVHLAAQLRLCKTQCCLFGHGAYYIRMPNLQDNVRYRRKSETSCRACSIPTGRAADRVDGTGTVSTDKAKIILPSSLLTRENREREITLDYRTPLARCDVGQLHSLPDAQLRNWAGAEHAIYAIITFKNRQTTKELEGHLYLYLYIYIYSFFLFTCNWLWLAQLVSHRLLSCTLRLYPALAFLAPIKQASQPANRTYLLLHLITSNRSSRASCS